MSTAEQEQGAWEQFIGLVESHTGGGAVEAVVPVPDSDFFDSVSFERVDADHTYHFIRLRKNLVGYVLNVFGIAVTPDHYFDISSADGEGRYPETPEVEQDILNFLSFVNTLINRESTNPDAAAVNRGAEGIPDATAAQAPAFVDHHRV